MKPEIKELFKLMTFTEQKSFVQDPQKFRAEYLPTEIHNTEVGLKKYRKKGLELAGQLEHNLNRLKDIESKLNKFHQLHEIDEAHKTIWLQNPRRMRND